MRRRRTTAVVASAALLFSVAGGLIAAPAAQAAGCTSGVTSDFNGDGVRDTAIADPLATVSGQEKAGAVQIVYGGGKGVSTLSQDTANVSDVAEAGDQFGFSLAAYDANLDGCTDLAVGMPYEDVNAVQDAGLVQLIYGSPAGIGQGMPSLGFRQGTDGNMADAYEAKDWVGYSVAGGVSSTGVPFLVIGVPGEDSSGLTDMGLAAYASGVTPVVTSFHQNSPDVWHDPVAGNRFGSAVAATSRHFVVGTPGAPIGSTDQAGAVVAFKPSLNANNIPQPLFGIGQDSTGTDDTAAETGDGFATAVAMAPYRSSDAATATDSLVAVGVPNEDVGTAADAGAVQLLRIAEAGAVTENAWMTQGTSTDDVTEAADAGDYFGQHLAAANTDPSVVGTATTMRLAVGVPGEEAPGDAADSGAVQIFPMLGAPGVSDSLLRPGSGIPSASAPRQFAGMSVAAAGASLYVGMPYGPASGRAVHAYAWTVASGGSPSQTWKPGEGGIPSGAQAFGAVVR
ncbi:integrin alpha [Streptomyces longwoodensis]|uniref:integrin alpha n=1 Tax=Streptomyces longwoodensis TaxID=68231 RepID=UPI0034046AF4